MSYRYQCRACRASMVVDSREEAEHVRTLHRAVEHGGLAPDGEELLPSAVPVPQGPPPVSTRKALLLLGVLAAVLVVARLLSH
ncbi:hypothetical protein [Streptomyces sp. NPDC059649]|uniref:hypothetical protein n=1 Tax=Streptomyces sp. NPDC059649 TaxID=3346895 RepID=UPI00369E7266